MARARVFAVVCVTVAVCVALSHSTRLNDKIRGGGFGGGAWPGNMVKPPSAAPTQAQRDEGMTGETKCKDANNIAFTIDDGPDPLLMAGTLWTLADNGAKATFFISGFGVQDLKARLESQSGVIKNILDAGHSIGFHSSKGHPFGGPLTKKQVLDDIDASQAAVNSSYGGPVPVKFYRATWLVVTDAMREAAKERGLTIVGADSTPDWPGPNQLTSLQGDLGKAYGFVTLVHQYATYVTHHDSLLKAITRKEKKAVTVEECLGLGGGGGGGADAGGTAEESAQIPEGTSSGSAHSKASSGPTPGSSGPTPGSSGPTPGSSGPTPGSSGPAPTGANCQWSNADMWNGLWGIGADKSKIPCGTVTKESLCAHATSILHTNGCTEQQCHVMVDPLITSHIKKEEHCSAALTEPGSTDSIIPADGTDNVPPGTDSLTPTDGTGSVTAGNTDSLTPTDGTGSVTTGNTDSLTPTDGTGSVTTEVKSTVVSEPNPVEKSPEGGVVTF